MSGRDGSKTKGAGEKQGGEKDSKGSCGTKSCDKGCGGKKDTKK